MNRITPIFTIGGSDHGERVDFNLGVAGCERSLLSRFTLTLSSGIEGDGPVKIDGTERIPTPSNGSSEIQGPHKKPGRFHQFIGPASETFLGEMFPSRDPRDGQATHGN
jgi:hypothetical protein